MSEADDRVPCPHPLDFRGGADCHLCGNSGFVLPGSRWVPPPSPPPEASDESAPEPNGQGLS